MSLAHGMNRVGQIRNHKEQSAERRGEVLCAMRMWIFTPTLTLPRQGGGDYKAVGQPVGGDFIKLVITIISREHYA